MSSEKSEKSKGIVAFAYNTDKTDYVAIANKTVKLASEVLGMPYTLVTDGYVPLYNNSRYSIDEKDFVQWRNIGRHNAYELSPYDETLVIDVDYIVQDRSLLEIFKTDWDYLLMRRTHTLSEEYPTYMGHNSLPFIWATVFAFRKTDKAKQFFDLVNRIQINYEYYKDLFNVHGGSYRNDYAFAMADIILNGYTVQTASIPGSMLTVSQPINSITINGNNFIVKDNDAAYVVPQSNMHIMSKRYLQSEDFQNFINNVTA